MHVYYIIPATNTTVFTHSLQAGAGAAAYAIMTRPSSTLGLSKGYYLLLYLLHTKYQSIRE